MSDRDDPEGPQFVAIDGGANAPSDTLAADDMPDGANDEALKIKLNHLEQEHRDLDLAIETLEERMPYDRLTIQRLKKKKLLLKDEITRIHDILLPDIIA